MGVATRVMAAALPIVPSSSRRVIRFLDRRVAMVPSGIAAILRRMDAVVIGAGPGGLATSRELKRRGVEHAVLERGDAPAHTWANLYDSLVLHTGKHMSALPGLRFPDSTPLFPPRAEFVEYLRRYATTFELPIRTNAEVVEV